MSHTFTNFLFHCIWSTKHRHPFITKEIKPRLNSYIRAVIKKEGANLLFINGIEDHVHLLIAAPSTMLIPDLIEKLKPIATKWMNNTFPELKRKFAWQEGYAAFSVDRSNLQPIINYIENQEEHHKKVSYKDEYISFLKAQGIAFDPHFVFD